MIPDALYQDMRKLNAPEAKKLREAWFDGPCSGAKLTITECERLHELAGGQLHAAVSVALQETERVGAKIAYQKEQKKAAQKRRRQKKKDR